MIRYLIIFIIILFRQEAFSEIIGHFGRVEGNVRIKRRGASEFGKIVEGFTIGEGDLIITGEDGRVEMLFRGGYIFKMGKNSSLKIFQTLSTGKGDVLSRVIMKEGIFFVKIEKKGEVVVAPEIETPNALIFGKRGSIVCIKISGRTTSVNVLERRVVVKDKTEENSLVLEKGYRLEILGEKFPTEAQLIEPSESENLRKEFGF